MAIEILKHMSVFDAGKFDDKSFLVIGVGAVGSSIALGLAKLGITNITLWDDDVLEAHNVANQYLYGMGDVGSPKVEAAARNIKTLTDYEPQIAQKRYTGARLYFNNVFMCVDSMEARALILEGVRSNPYVDWCFDTRMAARSCMSMAFRPVDLTETAQYSETMYTDAEAADDVGTCGTVLSIGATAQIASQTTLWLAMSALNNEVTVNEVFQDMKTFNNLTRKYTSSVKW